MPGRLLLLTDDRCFTRLQREGELPGSLLIDAADRDYGFAPDTSRSEIVVRRRPDFLLPQEPGNPPDTRQPDEEGFDELFAELLGGVLCHLVLLENPADTADGLRGTEETVLQGAANLPALVHWYEQFQAQAARRAGKMKDSYRHVLILVCADSLRADEYDQFRRLTNAEAGRHPFLDVCYVMFPSLESGPNQAFHSRYVWPVAVSRLLLRLLVEGPPEPTEGLPVTRAWRAYGLMPKINPNALECIYEEALKAAYARVSQEMLAEGMTWEAGKFDPPTVTVPRFPLNAKAQVLSPEEEAEASLKWQGWQEYPARKEIEKAAAAHRWESALKASAGRFAQEVSKASLAVPSSWETAQALWGDVHAHPRHIYAALKASALNGPDISAHYETIVKAWQEIQACDTERQRSMDNALQCAPVLEDVQRHFLPMPLRLVFAAVVTLFVSYFAWAAFTVISTKWTTPALVALAAGAGAFVTAMVTLTLERRAGRRAIRGFGRVLATIDEMIRRRHDRCQDSIETAAGFGVKLRAKAAAERMKAMLKRVQLVLDRELEPQLSPPDEPEQEVSEDVGTGYQGAHRGARFLRQRASFRRQTSIELNGQDNDYPTEDDDDLSALLTRDEIEEIVDRNSEELTERLWNRYCMEMDPNQAGNLPARPLVARLRGFCSRFRSELYSQVYQRAIDQIRDRDYEWVRRLDEVQQQHFPYYMSCPMHVVSVRPEYRWCRLILRSDFHSEKLRDRDVTVVELPESLADLPAVGYYYQEFCVRFSCDQRSGLIVVRDHDA